jgi:GWxTD domain-containing protein
MHLTYFRNRLLIALPLSFLALLLLPAHADPGIYKKWLDEDVRWIIDPQGREAFLRLSTNQERDQFVEAFWARRDPTPGTLENEFKEEHYRRIAFANMHFASAVPGWKTDRGRIYIVYGPPDRIDRNPSPVARGKLQPTSDGSSSGYPYEVWHYQHINGMNRDVTVKFVDTCKCGNYQRQTDPSEQRELP